MSVIKNVIYLVCIYIVFVCVATDFLLIVLQTKT